jgi:hypothetical protein
VYHLLINRDAKGIGEAAIALKGWNTTAGADIPFGKGIKFKGGQTWSHRMDKLMQNFGDNATRNGHLFDFTLRFENDHNPAYPLTASAMRLAISSMVPVPSMVFSML